MFERIRQMIRKEFKQTFRDPKMRGIILVAPMIQILLFGYAVSTDVRDVQLAFIDADQSVASRDLAARFAHSGHFTIKAGVTEEAEAERLMDHGEVGMIMCIRHGFQEDLKAGRTAAVQVALDGSDSNTARVAGDYAARIIRAYAREKLEDRMSRALGAVEMVEPITLETRAWFNENLESRNFFVPGVIASLLTLITLLLTSMAVVREKEIGTLEQMIATPIRRYEFILGKTIPFALIGYIDAVLILAAGMYWFEVPMRGSVLFLFAAISLYLMSTIGIGLLISALSHTQQQAMMSTFFVFNPALLLSGFVFPIANMPAPIQWVTLFNPMRYILVIIRAVFLKGSGFDLLWPQMFALAVIGIVTLSLAVQRVHKTMA